MTFPPQLAPEPAVSPEPSGMPGGGAARKFEGAVTIANATTVRKKMRRSGRYRVIGIICGMRIYHEVLAEWTLFSTKTIFKFKERLNTTCLNCQVGGWSE